MTFITIHKRKLSGHVKRIDKNLIMVVSDIKKVKCPKCKEVGRCVYDSYAGTGAIMCLNCTFCWNKNNGDVLNEGALK